MTAGMREAFRMERAYQLEHGISCQVHVNGLTDFVFVNRFGNVQHQGTLNKALRRIIRDCNQEQLDLLEKKKIKKSELVLLPKFSCHSLRHTCATRLCEAGINMKVVQDVLGHADISTTMNIYTDATKDFKVQEMGRYDEFLKSTQQNVAD